VEDAPWLGETGEGDIREDRSEAYGEQQKRLIPLGDCEIDKDEADPNH